LALARLSLPEEVRGSAAAPARPPPDGPGSSALFSATAVFSLALDRIGHAAMHQNGGGFLARFGFKAEGGNVALMEAGQLFHRPFDVLGQWFLPLMMIMSLARPTMNR
jgi:hypothetical protein